MFLLISISDSKIRWYRNRNGDGSSWTTNVVTTSADSAVFLFQSVFAADIDGDGHMDLASASAGKIDCHGTAM